jgi:hypothetical protein
MPRTHAFLIKEGMLHVGDLSISTGRYRSTTHGTFDTKQLGIAFTMKRMLLPIVTDGVGKGRGVVDRIMAAHTPEAFGVIFLIKS